jgi:hypothetical protein
MPPTVNEVIHQVRTHALVPIHEMSRRVDRLWRSKAGGQPPIANISMRGSVEVAAERNSE